MEQNNTTYSKINYTEFADNYKQLKSSNYFVGIFKGIIDPSTGKNWCEDCEVADPIIKTNLLPECEKLNIPVLDVAVGPKEE